MKTKHLQTYLFWAILGLGVGYVIFGKGDISVDIDSYKTEINLLQQKIDSISSQNNTLKVDSETKNTNTLTIIKLIFLLSIKNNFLK